MAIEMQLDSSVTDAEELEELLLPHHSDLRLARQVGMSATLTSKGRR
ncbi:MAG: hypothetical protein JWN70_6577 [Planctomycetaceae bacterium]|nr:hypothetical protein [Planctomycetaceae bacterium]